MRREAPRWVTRLGGVAVAVAVLTLGVGLLARGVAASNAAVTTGASVDRRTHVDSRSVTVNQPTTLAGTRSHDGTAPNLPGPDAENRRITSGPIRRVL